jgi:hypothetical protein
MMKIILIMMIVRKGRVKIFAMIRIINRAMMKKGQLKISKKNVH